jgi:hypothetical protein
MILNNPSSLKLLTNICFFNTRSTLQTTQFCYYCQVLIMLLYKANKLNTRKIESKVLNKLKLRAIHTKQRYVMQANLDGHLQVSKYKAHDLMRNSNSTL